MISHRKVGQTPVTEYVSRGAGDGPTVIVTHGFAGSQQMMQGYALPRVYVSGAWEARLRAFAQDAVVMVSPSVTEGETAISDGVQRLAVAAPFSEHVSVLQSRFARAQTLAWLDKTYDQTL